MLLDKEEPGLEVPERDGVPTDRGMQNSIQGIGHEQKRRNRNQHAAERVDVAKAPGQRPHRVDLSLQGLAQRAAKDDPDGNPRKHQGEDVPRNMSEPERPQLDPQRGTPDQGAGRNDPTNVHPDGEQDRRPDDVADCQEGENVDDRQQHSRIRHE